MESKVTDHDIVIFLRENREGFPSEITLMQAAVQLLWPEGVPDSCAERVVRLSLQDGVNLSTTPERLIGPPPGHIDTGTLYS